jgi:hypothetical protein
MPLLNAEKACRSPARTRARRSTLCQRPWTTYRTGSRRWWLRKVWIPRCRDHPPAVVTCDLCDGESAPSIPCARSEVRNKGMGRSAQESIAFTAFISQVLLQCHSQPQFQTVPDRRLSKSAGLTAKIALRSPAPLRRGVCDLIRSGCKS